MSAPSIITRVLDSFGGRNSRANDIARPPLFCRDSLNFEMQLGGSLANRPGYQALAFGGGGGQETYRYLLNAVPSSEVVVIDNKLKRKVSGAFSISYPTAGDNPTVSFIPKRNVDGTYTMHCVLSINDGVVQDYDLGLGTGESSPYLLSTLIAAINGLADWACSLTSGISSIPAAFVPVQELVGIASTGTSFSFDYHENIYSPLANPFSTFYAKFALDTHENASLVNCDDQLFVATGSNELYCYDSRACYRAGLPAASTLAIASQTTGGSLTLLGVYEYFITYEMTNQVGRVIESDESNRVTVTLTGSNNKVNLTIPYIDPFTSGFFTHCGIPTAGGGSATNTFTGITAGHCARVGDVIAFTNFGSGLKDTRTVASVTATTITCGGAAFAYVANQPIYLDNGPKIVINIWRNAVGDTELKYLVATIDNDITKYGSPSSITTVTYADTMADATLIGNADYTYPDKGHGLPPANLKYLTVFNGLLVGATARDGQVWYSDYDGPHYFPVGSSAFNVLSKNSSAIKGLGANRQLLMVNKTNETLVVTGDLPGANFRQELVSTSIGCDAHTTIQDIDGVLWFWSQANGYRALISSGAPLDMSYRVLGDFAASKVQTDTSLIGKRAVAVNLGSKRHIQLCVPTETNHAGAIVPNSETKLFCCDYREQTQAGEDGYPMTRWFPFGAINLSGGASVHNERLYWTARQWNAVTNALETVLYVRLENGSQYDFHDHAQPIQTSYDFQWFHAESPTVWKKWIRAKVYALDNALVSGFTIDAHTELDFINGLESSRATLSMGDPGGSSYGWGVGPWGGFGWGETAIMDDIFEFRPRVAQALKLSLDKTVWCEQVRFSGVAIQFVPQYEEQIAK